MNEEQKNEFQKRKKRRLEESQAQPTLSILPTIPSAPIPLSTPNKGAIVLAKAIAHGTKDEIDFLIKYDAIEALGDLLSNLETNQNIILCLDALESILGMGGSDNSQNPYIEKISPLKDKMEEMTNHYQFDISAKSSNLLKTYYGAEDDY
eukprot:TRINITY_DN1865_c0_g1_i1.p1 TRINITY_DN1865_c0_g1~~TRINITY_DN1865_c0_g1_i1.p1  ORF type:complete len:150 (+),score=50.85 TRINITY_DN1865_c0_g1_i1:162-611(+)